MKISILNTIGPNGIDRKYKEVVGSTLSLMAFGIEIDVLRAYDALQHDARFVEDDH